MPAAAIQFDSATCTNCYTTFDHLPVEPDEDCGGSVTIPALRCFYPGCQVKLCPSCPKFKCDGCGHSFCSDHQLVLDGLALCPACVPDAMEGNAPPCRCTQTTARLFDARGCMLHDPNSEWNQVKRAITDREKYQGMVA